MQAQPQNRIFSNHDLRILIFPLVIELALELIVGLLDSVMVSSVGEAAVSGVSLVDSVMQLLIYIFAALASGGAVVAGQYLGAKKQAEARFAAGELIRLNLVLSVAIALVMLAAQRWILTHVFGQIDAAVYYHAEGYFSVAVFTIPAIGVYEAGTAIFRTMNNAKITMKTSLLINVMNGIGNAILIYGCAMGTAGAALSTLIARWTAAVIIVVLLLNPKRVLSVKTTLVQGFDFKMSRRILTMGVPNGVENAVFQLGKVMILGLVATFGVSAITANAVTQTLASIEMIPGSAIQLAAIPIIARCVGAEDYAQAKYYNRKLLAISYLSVLGWSLGMVCALPAILSFYQLSESTHHLVVTLFLWHTAGAVTLWPLAFDLPASLRAAGDVRFPMLISIASMWIFRFGGAHLLSKGLGLGIAGVWIAMAILDWGFRAGVYLYRWHGGKWMEKCSLIE
ncbi:MAG: MATE family efflux transporter [Eubacterium sp.]|nr:MATE family efflux transporter [Eubacterium sp.]